MGQVKIVIVDDSPFSVAMISNILTQNGFDVVGNAGNLEQTVEAVSKLKPDIVTMDISMPGADGIECTKAVHIIDPNIKVIIISSMLDDEIVRSAKKAKAAGYIQKPVDSEELSLLINRITADKELFFELEKIYFEVFKEAMTCTFNKFLKIKPSYDQVSFSNIDTTSRGISVVMGIIGKYGGRMILDLSGETASLITAQLLRRKDFSKDEIINIIGELSNVIAGNACSIINRSNELFGLRVAPPTVVYGESINISKSELDTVSSVKSETPLGEIFMSAGFKRGEYE